MRDITSIYSRPNIVAVGSSVNNVGTVDVFSADDHQKQFTLTPFGAGFHGEVRVATGDVNGDGVPDISVGTGAGNATQVQIIDGATQKILFSVSPFESSFTGGVFVAMGGFDTKFAEMRRWLRRAGAYLLQSTVFLNFVSKPKPSA